MLDDCDAEARDRVWPRRMLRVWLMPMVVGLVLLVMGAALSADPEWPSSNTSLGYSDDSDFNYTSTESNTGDYYESVPYVDFAMFNVWGSLTDLVARSKYRTYYSWIDIYWYMTQLENPESGGDAICRAWKNQSARICDRNRVRYTENLLNRTPGTYSTMVKRNTTCHEVGHAVGFGHGTTGRSCMDGGNNATISWYERSLVNARY